MMAPECRENPCSKGVETSLTQHSGGDHGWLNPAGERPLWLTLQEVELLIVLCATSPTNGGTHEEPLFAKLGDFFRWFSQ